MLDAARLMTPHAASAAARASMSHVNSSNLQLCMSRRCREARCREEMRCGQLCTHLGATPLSSLILETCWLHSIVVAVLNVGRTASSWLFGRTASSGRYVFGCPDRCGVTGALQLTLENTARHVHLLTTRMARPALPAVPQSKR